MRKLGKKFYDYIVKMFAEGDPSPLRLMIIEWGIILAAILCFCLVAALTGGIYRMIWDRFGDFPADFFLGFQSGFRLVFFLMCTSCFGVTVRNEIAGKGKGHSLKKEKHPRHFALINFGWKSFIIAMTAVIFLLPGWFLGGRQTVAKIADFAEDWSVSSYEWGERYSQSAHYRNAASNYKKAIFLDKYIVFWNDNSRLPIYYSALAQALMNQSDYEGMYEADLKSIAAYSRYRPADEIGAAFVQYHAAMACSMLEKEEEELRRCQITYDCLTRNSQNVNEMDTAKIGIWLAHCYYEQGDYGAACELLETNIPRFYAAIDWGIGDDVSAQLVAIAYRYAWLSYEKLPDMEKADEYREKYSDFLFLRDYVESELTELAAGLGWDE